MELESARILEVGGVGSLRRQCAPAVRCLKAGRVSSESMDCDGEASKPLPC